MKLSEALKLVQGAAGDEEVDAILVELLRAPSPQTEKLEADPNLRAYVRDVVAPRLETLTGAKPEIDGMGNLLLNGKNVLQLAVVTFRPEMVVIRDVYQLDRYAQTLARFTHAPFQQSNHLEFLADLANV